MNALALQSFSFALAYAVDATLRPITDAFGSFWDKIRRHWVITQAMCTSFKQEILVKGHDFTVTTGDVFKIALFTSSATLSAATTVYAATNEVVGTGYTAGGNTLTNVTPTTSGTTAFCDFADTSWSTATITARGALIYNSSNSNKAVAVLDFGADKTSTAGTFTIVFPTADASNAILRIA